MTDTTATITDLQSLTRLTANIRRDVERRETLRREALAEWDADWGVHLTAARARYDELRATLTDQMVQQGVGRIEADDVSAIIDNRTLFTVTDEASLRDAIASVGRLNECLTLDLPAVRRLLKEARREGWEEALTGYEETVQRTLRVTDRRHALD